MGIRLRLWLAVLGVFCLVAIVGSLLCHQPRKSGDERASAPKDVTSSASGLGADRSDASASQPEPSQLPEAAAPTRQAIDGEMRRATGTVMSETGEAVGGASVVAMRDDLVEPIPLATDPGTSADLHRVRTDREGRFAIDLDRDGSLFSLVAEAKGYSPGIVTSVRSGDEVLVTLARSRALVGRVVDMEGATVAGAHVRWLSLLGRGCVEREGISRPDGSYRIDDLPAAGALSREGRGLSWWSVEVRAPGFAPLFLEQYGDDSSAADIVLDLVLVAGASLRGRVIDAETGEPIAKSPVQLRSTEGLAIFEDADRRVFINPTFERVLDKTVAGEDGWFAFAHAPSVGFHRDAVWQGSPETRSVGLVVARPAGYAAGAAAVRLGNSGESLEVAVRCWPAATVRGRVRDGTGAPLASVLVEAAPPEKATELPWSPRGARFGSARTDAGGDYVLVAATSSQGRSLEVKAQLERRRFSAGSLMTASPSTAKTTVVVRPGETIDAPDLVIAAPSAVLVIVDQNERPIWGARAVFENYALQPLQPAEDSDRNGRLQLFFSQRTKLVSPEEFRIRAPGHAPATATGFTPSATQPPEIRVVLGTARHVRGIVKYDDGSPAAHVWVAVANAAVPPTEEFPEGSSWIRKPTWPPLVHYGWTRSREDGTFEVSDLPEGPYNVAAVSHPPYLRGGSLGMRGNGVFSTAVTGVQSDATDVILTVPLHARPEPRPPSAVIEGTVNDAANGKPVSDFVAELRSGKRLRRARALSPGRFRIENVALGTWTLAITSPAYARYESPGLTVDREGALVPVHIDLDGGTTVRGLVNAPPDLDLRKVTLFFLEEDMREGPSCKIADDSSYVAHGFAPGRYVVRVAAPDPMALERPRELVIPPGGGEITLDLSLVGAGTLHVEVHGHRLAPARDHSEIATAEQQRATASSRLVVQRKSEADLVHAWKNITDGFFSIVDLPPGRYVLRLLTEESAVAEKEFTIEAGRNAAVVLELP